MVYNRRVVPYRNRAYDICSKQTFSSRYLHVPYTLYSRKSETIVTSSVMNSSCQVTPNKIKNKFGNVQKWSWNLEGGLLQESYWIQRVKGKMIKTFFKCYQDLSRNVICLHYCILMKLISFLHAYIRIANLCNIMIASWLWERHFSVNSLWYFLIFGTNINCWCSLEHPWWGSSNKHPHSVFLARIRKTNIAL